LSSEQGVGILGRIIQGRPIKPVQRLATKITKNRKLNDAYDNLNENPRQEFEQQVAEPYSGPTKDCYSFDKNCIGCRGYLSSCCSDKNCGSGRKCKAGVWSYSCDTVELSSEQGVGILGRIIQGRPIKPVQRLATKIVKNRKLNAAYDKLNGQLQYYGACGDSGNKKCSKALGSNVGVYSKDASLGVRCVSETKIAGWMHKRRKRCIWTTTFWWESNIIGGSCQARTFDDAVSFCAQFGARLPTYDEVVSDCVKDSGCKFDKTHIWTSTPVGPEE